MSATQQENRDYWAKRFPEVTSDWPYWWIEGDSYCLAIIEGGNLAAAVEIVEDNWEAFNTIKAFKAKILDSDLARKEARSAVITSRSSSEKPPDRRE